MDYRGVIFDFNGTLFFDNDKHVKAWGAISQLLRDKGITDEELHEHFNGVPNKQIIQYMLGDKCTEDDIVKYSSLKEEYYRKFCKEDIENFHLVKGSEEYFDLLTEKKVPFTIASASIKENIDFFVESFNLDKWIAPSDIVYDDGTYENKIAIFKKAADVIKTDIKDCLNSIYGTLGIKGKASIKDFEDYAKFKEARKRIDGKQVRGYIIPYIKIK